MKIPLTQEMINQLNDHKDRTGVGSKKLLRGRRQSTPKGLDSMIVQFWMRGEREKVNKAHWAYIIGLYEALPDNPWIKIDEELRAGLDDIKQRLQGQLKVHLRKIPPPDGLTYGTALDIVSGRTDKVRQNYLAYLRAL